MKLIFRNLFRLFFCCPFGRHKTEKSSYLIPFEPVIARSDICVVCGFRFNYREEPWPPTREAQGRED